MSIPKILHDFGDFSSIGRCKRIAERHAATIKVKKPQVAAKNLERIISAVLRLSNRTGFHAMSMQSLAKESGLSIGGLYAYIDSKDQILDMILDEVLASVTTLLASPPPEVKQNPHRHLSWLIKMHIFLTEAMQEWFLFVYMEAKSFPAATKKRAIKSEATTEQIFAGTLRQGCSLGIFTTDDPDFCAALIKPMLQDWYVKRGKWRRRGITPMAYAKQLERFVEASILTLDSGQANFPPDQD
ncbi:MAG: TetR/AcrR family transcriptional regulator [Marinosulfonomonas sp.]|nr:TetR/AcrR family transcriptional regulator [Marinosulfonomonas sp.]